LLFALGFIVGLNNAGFDVGAVLAGLGIGGLAFALAAQDTVANLFGGVTILLQRPFRLQDRISVAGIEGYVLQLGLRTTQLKTISGEKVQLPNKFFTANSIHNLDVCDYYYEFEAFLLHRTCTPAQIDSFMESLRELATGHEDVAWCMPVVHQVNELGFEIRLGYGVLPFLNTEKYFNHFEKIATVKTFLNRNAIDIMDRLQIRMAHPAYLTLRRDAR
jgi:MscS family membrane protein